LSAVKDIHSDLVERCRQGDRIAQKSLYENYAKAMYNVSLRIVNDTGAAQDILQDAFVDAFTKISQFRQDASFGSWLKRIVINKSLNHMKRSSRMVEIKEAGTMVTEEPNDDNIQYSMQHIKDAMDNISDGYRVVFSLFAIEGLSHREIAEELGITESTSKSQYLRARKRIKEHIINAH